jgi:hypothetical protein
MIQKKKCDQKLYLCSRLITIVGSMKIRVFNFSLFSWSRLQDDFLKLASDDKQGRDIQDLELLGGK